MNNKKGFTIVELLAVIVVIVIITTIAIAVFKNMNGKVVEKEYNNLISSIETAAERYASDSGIEGIITLQDLIDEGYITPDDRQSIYNPLDNESLNCNKILISYDDNYNKYVSKFTNDKKELDANNKCNADFVQLYELNHYTNVVEIKEANIILLIDLSNSMNTSIGSGSSETRLTAEKKVVNDLADYLFNNNYAINISLITYKDEASLIDFDNQTSILVNNASNLNSFKNTIDSMVASGNTNWEDALYHAKQLSFDNDYSTYVIFVSDGDPTMKIGGGNGRLTDDNIQTCYNAAVDDAQEIVASGKKLYTIGAYGNIERMRSLTIDAGASTDNYYPASNASEIYSAFKSILSEIKERENNGKTYLSQDGIINLGILNLSGEKPLNIYNGNELIKTYTSADNTYLIKKDKYYYFDITKFSNDKNIPIKNINIKYYSI